MAVIMAVIMGDGIDPIIAHGDPVSIGGAQSWSGRPGIPMAIMPPPLRSFSRLPRCTWSRNSRSRTTGTIARIPRVITLTSSSVRAAG